MRKILLAAIIMLLTVASNAQIDSVRLELDHIFQHINKTLISTGYLNEYGPEVVNKKWITGPLSTGILFTIPMYSTCCIMILTFKRA